MPHVLAVRAADWHNGTGVGVNSTSIPGSLVLAAGHDTGTFETEVFNLGHPRPFVDVSWGAHVPSGSSVGVMYRVGHKSPPAGPWTALPGDGFVWGRGPFRYVQLRLTLAGAARVDLLQLTVGGLMLYINGQEYTAHLRARTFKRADRLNERSTCDLALNATAADGLTPFDPVLVMMDGVCVFDGAIYDTDEARLVEVEGERALVVDVRCIDLHRLADKRRVPETYDNKTAGWIVKNLLAKYLAVEGVQAGVIQDGPNVTRAVFGYDVTFSDAMQYLSELAGFVWRLRPGASGGRYLDFAAQVDDNAPFELNERAPVMRFGLRRHREMYRNKEFVRAGIDTTDPRTDSFQANGENRTYTCAFALNNKPSVTVNGVPVPDGQIGIRGLDPAGKTWFWSKGDFVVNQGDDQVAVPAGQRVEVTYQGQFPIVVELTDAAEIEARAAEEGGSGIYEEVDQVSIDSSDAALQFAQGKLSQFARLNGEVVFSTQTPGLRAGQLLAVDMPAHDLHSTYLISEVNLTDAGLGFDGEFAYEVRALDGSAVGGWVQFFRNLTRQGEKFAIRDNEVLVRMKGATDTLAVLDAMSMTAGAPANTVGFAEVGASEVAP